MDDHTRAGELLSGEAAVELHMCICQERLRLHGSGTILEDETRKIAYYGVLLPLAQGAFEKVGAGDHVQALVRSLALLRLMTSEPHCLDGTLVIEWDTLRNFFEVNSLTIVLPSRSAPLVAH